MVTAIPSEGRDISSRMAGRFARAPFFIVFDEEGKVCQCIDNSSTSMAHGAGGSAVRILAENNIDSVMVPQVGPNAAMALKAAQIKVYETPLDTVSNIIGKYLKGDLKQVSL